MRQPGGDPAPAAAPPARDLPPPTDTGDVYLAAILAKLDDIERLIGQQQPGPAPVPARKPRKE